MTAFPPEDLSPQIAAQAAARDDLVSTLDELLVAAKDARRACSASKPNAERIAAALARVYGASRSIETAETAFDMATTDLASASGHDV